MRPPVRAGRARTGGTPATGPQPKKASAPEVSSRPYLRATNLVTLAAITLMAILLVVLLSSSEAAAAPGTPDRGGRARAGSAAPAADAAPPAAPFTNRVAAAARFEPSSTGRLPALESGADDERPIRLAAGYTLVRGGRAPRLPADVASVAARPGEAGRGDAFLVRIPGTAPDAALARLERAGATSIATLSDGTWLVRLDAGARARLEAPAGGATPWLEPWRPAYKLSPRIDRAAAGRVEVAALLFADGDVDAAATALGALGARRVRGHRGALNRLVRFELEGARIAEAAALADVQWIEPAPRDTVFNDLAQWVVQTGVNGSRKMWDHGLRGAGQIVMAGDSGVRPNHMLFWDAAQDITGYGHFPGHRKIVAYLPGDDVPEIAFGDESATGWHGTHTAGTIAGNDDPHSTLPYDGIAKDARLWVTDLSGPLAFGGIETPDDLNDLFQPSYTGNAAGAARISSNSWGSTTNGEYTLSCMQVDQFVWNHPDYLIAFANGNNAYPGSVGSPASAKNCLSVGGTGNGERQNWIFYATSRGPTEDLRRKPTVCAPGEDVISSVANTRFAYASYSGTSMATPAAAGALAIVRQYLAEGWYPTGAPVAANAFSPSAALLKAIAVGSAVNDVLGFAAPDNNVGWGRLDLDQVLYFPGDSSRTLLVDAAPGLLDREYAEYQVMVRDASQPLRVALCWTDAPGNPAVVRQIVNDLDLVVTNGATTYLGNRFANGTSRTGGSRDSINVEEGVRIVAPAPGLWTIRVEGHRVPTGPQPFALCITGTIAGESGALALDRFDYALEDTLEVEVLDTDAPGPPAVRVTSATEPGGELVALAGGDGVYRGSLALAPVPAAALDGRLSVSSGDVLTVEYADATSGATLATTARVNVQAPVVSEVHARALGADRVLVTWTTDLPATSRVRYGTAPPLLAAADSSGLGFEHSVLLEGLAPGQLYRYDVESVSLTGSRTCDSLGGAHRTFTTRGSGLLALVLGDTSPRMLDTWMNAFDALGWEADILAGPAMSPPLVGGATAGLRRYAGVLWQVDPNHYPPFTDGQRAAVDSLIEGGGRLLVTGHDIGYALSDAGSPAYSPEREQWLEQGLKARYYYDDLNFSQVSGVTGDPVSGAWAAGVPYYPLGYGMAGDIVLPAPGTDGVGSTICMDNLSPPTPVGLRWESNAPKVAPGEAFWGGANSRLVDLFFEWSALGSTSAAHEPGRTGVLESATAWLLGHRPPRVTITSPEPGAVVAGDFLPVRWRIEPDAGRTVVMRSLSCSLDGGETWNTLPMYACSDSGTIVDLAGALGGEPIANSPRVLLRATATDDGFPALRGVDVSDGVFTIARAAGDQAGPVAIAGSIGTSPAPVRRGWPATLHASFSDMETGGGGISAAEFSWGGAPAPPGTGSPMSTSTTANAVEASADLPTTSLPMGEGTLWLRGRDTAGNWGPAAGFRVLANGDGVTGVDDGPRVDFMAAPAPNPFRGSATIRFGLARAGAVQLELFDLAGRRVRTLASGMRVAGVHAAAWDGRGDDGQPAGAGVYFVRLVTPAGTFRSRLVSLR
jgi:hypothetical protein